MRYLPNLTDIRDKFNDGARPPMNLIPKPLTALLQERDRVLVQRSDAAQLVNTLARESQDDAARHADDLAASQAARKGESIPNAQAVSQLAQDRVDAARALAAQEAALIDVTNECDTLASSLYWDDTKTAAAVAKTLAKVEAAVAALVDDIEAAVSEVAVRDWLRSHYHPSAQISPLDVLPDLARHGLTRENTRPVTVRAAITAAATAALTTDQEK